VLSDDGGWWMTIRSKSRAVSELIEEMFDESRYNSRARPGADSGQKRTAIFYFLHFSSLNYRVFLANVNSRSCRPSVVCMSVVCNVRAPYSVG